MSAGSTTCSEARIPQQCRTSSKTFMTTCSSQLTTWWAAALHQNRPHNFSCRLAFLAWGSRPPSSQGSLHDCPASFRTQETSCKREGKSQGNSNRSCRRTGPLSWQAYARTLDPPCSPFLTERMTQQSSAQPRTQTWRSKRGRKGCKQHNTEHGCRRALNGTRAGKYWKAPTLGHGSIACHPRNSPRTWSIVTTRLGCSGGWVSP